MSVKALWFRVGHLDNFLTFRSHVARALNHQPSTINL